MQEEISVRLREMIEAEPGLRQVDIAVAAGVSQPTVSRALKGEFKRPSEQRSMLFSYIQNRMGASTFSDRSKERVVAAFAHVWDGSDAHAAAIAKIISASKGLGPAKGRHKGSR